MAHDFTHGIRAGLSQGVEYAFIYCRKCGFVSYDQSKEAKNRDVPPCDGHIEISGIPVEAGPLRLLHSD